MTPPGTAGTAGTGGVLAIMLGAMMLIASKTTPKPAPLHRRRRR